MFGFTLVSVQTCKPDKELLTPLNHAMFRERGEKKVTEGVATEEMLTETVMSVVEGSCVLATIVSSKDEQPKGVFLIRDSDDCNPIGLYRTLKLIGAMPKLSPSLMSYAYSLGQTGRIPEDEDEVGSNLNGIFREHEAQLDSLLGANRVNAFLSEIPPYLDDVVRRLREAKVHVDVSALGDEVEAGRLAATPYLKSIGVLTGAEAQALFDREYPKTKVIVPIIRAFLNRMGKHDPDCECEQTVRRYAMGLTSRGIDDLLTLSGIALARVVELSSAIRFCHALPDNRAAIVRHVSRFLADYDRDKLGDNRKWRNIHEEIMQIFEKLEDMPIIFA